MQLKISKMNFSRIGAIVFLLFLGGYAVAQSDEIDEQIVLLGDSSQELRDKAAQKLKTIYVPSKQAIWEPFIEKLQKGQNKKKFLSIFKPYDLIQVMGFGSGQSHSVVYELDDDWQLVCWFENDGDKIISWELSEHTKSIWVEPKEKYSGTWITYFINGQKADEINYKDGAYFGELISYYSDGSKCFVQHYHEKGCNGTDTGYYPTGEVKYKGVYMDGIEIGVWNWYDKEGNITSTKEYPTP